MLHRPAEPVAQVGSALASWPDGSLDKLQSLASEHPRSSLLALHLGLAYYWTRRETEALTAWRAARTLQPDTSYAVRAGDFLQIPAGMPHLFDVKPGGKFRYVVFDARQ